MVSIFFNGTQIDLSPAVFQDTNNDVSFKQVYKQSDLKRDDTDGNDNGKSFRSAMEEEGAKIVEKRNVKARSKYYEQI
jgi:hypothetical protein